MSYNRFFWHHTRVHCENRVFCSNGVCSQLSKGCSCSAQQKSAQKETTTLWCTLNSKIWKPSQRLLGHICPSKRQTNLWPCALVDGLCQAWQCKGSWSYRTTPMGSRAGLRLFLRALVALPAAQAFCLGQTDIFGKTCEVRIRLQ